MLRPVLLLLLLAVAGCATRTEAPACLGDVFPLNLPMEARR